MRSPNTQKILPQFLKLSLVVLLNVVDVEKKVKYPSKKEERRGIAPPLSNPYYL
jgi:hypothetical protein